MKKNKLNRTVLLGFIFFLSLSFLSSADATSLRRDAVVKAVEEASPAVVNISTEQLIRRNINPFSPFANDPFFDQFFEHFFEPRYEEKYTQKSLGSGVIFDKSGYILTNWHVVEKASRIKVILINEKVYEAKLIGSSPELDLAVLKIETPHELPTIKIGDSDNLMIGEKVIAIGNPFGLSHTVTTGVISAVSRSLKVGEMVYRDFIQTDASINPGNSGGPLLNIDGELIGINTAIYGQGAQGIGFAIPINKAKRVVDDLIRYGEISPVWVGIQVQELVPDLARYLGYPGEGGVLVKKVEPESPAQKAGIEKTDIITSIGNEKVRTTRDFWEILREYTPNDKILFIIFRKGRKLSISIKAEEFPVSKAEEFAFNLLGIEVKERFSPIHNRRTTPKGIVITGVKANSRAYRIGIKPGDLILQINETTINSLDDFRKAIANIFQKKNVLLLIKRGLYGYYLTIPLES
jgi:Do/DeqQ family serine protease